MKKYVSTILCGLALFFGGFFLLPEKAEATPPARFRAQIINGADGCIYLFCTNQEGSTCNQPGSLIKDCNGQ